MVPENVGNLSLFAIHPQDFLDDRIGITAPKPSPSELPAIDNITHQIQVAAFVVVQERQ